MASAAQTQPSGVYAAVLTPLTKDLEPDPALDAKLKKLLVETQQGDGSWNLFPGGEGHLSTTIEAYFALKLTGLRAGDEPMMQARRWILAHGGIVGHIVNGRRLGYRLSVFQHPANVQR